jgi:DNA (cytosine-5)-methyltransferase 1
MKLLDLFSGIGGFSLAARWANIETIQFVEKDEFCRKVLMKNFPNVPIHDDIRTFNFHQDVEILTGGFPCQPFSLAGKRKGFSDDRYLWPAMFRVIKQCRPRFIIAENVPGIIPMLDPILEDLENEGYTWQAYLIPASAIHAPHKRERLWIIAYSNSVRCNERLGNTKERPLQADWERYIKTLQTEWTEFQPQSWTTFNFQDWLGLAANTNSITSKQTNSQSITEQNQWNPRERHTRQHRKDSSIFNWEKDQPPISGVDDGLPNGMDRNKSLGNAIVPQIAYIFLKAIVLHGT